MRGEEGVKTERRRGEDGIKSHISIKNAVARTAIADLTPGR